MSVPLSLQRSETTADFHKEMVTVLLGNGLENNDSVNGSKLFIGTDTLDSVQNTVGMFQKHFMVMNERRVHGVQRPLRYGCKVTVYGTICQVGFCQI